MDYRLRKQISIAAIFFLVIGSVVYFFVFRPFSSESICSNNKKDRNEEGVDCGGICPNRCIVIKDLEIISQKLFKISESEDGNLFDYDFLAVLRNPNVDLGAADVVYELKLTDQNDSQVLSKEGRIYFLPGQIRYEVVSPIKTTQEIFGAALKIKQVNWQKLKEFVPQNLFLVKSQEYQESSEGGNPIAGATIFNNTNFDFDRVDVNVVLYDEDNQALAVNRTDIRTFLGKTDRFFEVKWPGSFSGKVVRVDIQAYTDVFRNENFIKEHGAQEEFQKFYQF